MNKSFLVFIISVFASCNGGDRQDNDVSNTIDKTAGESRAINLKLKDSVLLVYQKFSQSSADSVLKIQGEMLFESVSTTDRLIDSLQNIIKPLDRNDVEHVTTIRNLLADGPLGDSLSRSLDNALLQAKDFAADLDQKSAIDSIRNSIFLSMGTGKDWQSELFGMTNPLGASLLLLGLQNELYQATKIAFEE